jgi:maltose alpha-D-glucosyltransferase/alpha-amylase
MSSGQAWYKDLDIYQVHVRTFFDSNDDGIGDLRGLTEKLGYIRDLGVGAVWLQPIFPSPLQDGGYDVTDFRNVHPDLGTLDDFTAFLTKAHHFGLRVLLDLVLNHTSREHPWFQSALNGPGSPFHDYYVWSPTPDRYAQARIIFPDTESSNWTLEPRCGLYYWHRFYSHQPDLNYDNPKLREEILAIVRFWLDLGVDGFRVDAAPYLFERDGTSCDNLPETHQFFRELRIALEAYAPPRVLLAEANQKVSDLMSFFGQGDEFHLAFHFPLMPRLFMAVHQESARPLIEILSSMPRLPQGCQWAMFLRNHDELTLEMLSDEERSYMLSAFGSTPSMRFNLGIRRRLWPLMMGGRRQIELLHGLILGLPGSAVFYYGDEIGMGDDLQLNERFPVRTPMQWSPDRNAGFSGAETSRLTIPVVRLAEYHYAGHNVESQERLPTSFLNWFRRMIKTHREVKAFRSREARLLGTDNPHVLAFEREDEGELALCVYNLSRFVQPARLDLAARRGRTPFEIIGSVAFPPIEDRPYFLSLGPHSFMWFRLRDSAKEAP